MEKFAFVLHPLSLEDMQMVSPFVRYVPDFLLEYILQKKKPFEVSHITGVRSPYAEAEGWFVGCPLTAKQMMELPEEFVINDNMIVPPAPVEEMDKVEVLKGPNIKPYPATAPPEKVIVCGCSLKVGDNITTDHIMPAGAKILPLRSNIPAISKFCFAVCDENFSERAKEMGKSIIVGGSNYGQGSSREHAALAPLYLGVKAVLVKSFARIHRANLVNAGILPLTFVNEADYDIIDQGDELALMGVREAIENNCTELTLTDRTKGKDIKVLCELSGRAKDIMLAGGLLDYTRESLK
jgi:aconitate hydratase